MVLRKGSVKMKSSGYVRKLDPMGRIVIPSTCRERLGLSKDDSVEIFLDGSSLMIRKYQPACVFCDSMDNTFSYMGKTVCESCAQKLMGYKHNEAF